MRRSSINILLTIIFGGFCTFTSLGDGAVTLPPYVGDARTTKTIVAVADLKSNKSEKENDLVIPELSIPTLTIPESPTIKTIDNYTPVAISELKIEDMQGVIDSAAEKVKYIRNNFVDQRNVLQNNLFLTSDSVADKWIQIYNFSYPTIGDGELPPGTKMIAEVRMPTSLEQAQTLYDNLAFRKKQGYNSVLLTFDGSEKVQDLCDLATYIKEFGFNVWFAFGGKEDIRETTFIDPDTYAEYLYNLATICDGFISHWRRTSSHLFLQDDAFMQYTAFWVRSGKMTIPILGEIYLGETYATSEKYDWIKPIRTNSNGLKVNLVERLVGGGSGYLLVNFGTNNINAEWVMNVLLKSVDKPKYILINGPSVYYLTSGKTTSDHSKNLAEIEAIEQRWLKAGCIGVVVLHGDGSEGTYVSDNMSEYRLNNFNQ